MPLADLLTSDRIAVLAAPAGRDGVLDAAARLLGGSGPDTAAIAASLRERERLGCTAIGHGVAIPHGRSRAWADARGAFLRLAAPVDFDAPDGEPVDLVFAMAVPEHYTQQHLQRLAELAERFSDAAFRDALRAAPGERALRDVLMRPRAARAA